MNGSIPAAVFLLRSTMSDFDEEYDEIPDFMEKQYEMLKEAVKRHKKSTRNPTEQDIELWRQLDGNFTH